jgi:hypothetical protein
MLAPMQRAGLTQRHPPRLKLSSRRWSGDMVNALGATLTLVAAPALNPLGDSSGGSFSSFAALYR